MKFFKNLKFRILGSIKEDLTLQLEYIDNYLTQR